MQAGGVAEQTVGRDRRGQGLDDRGPAAGVLQAHPADVPFQVAGGEQREQGVLHGFRHPLAEVRAAYTELEQRHTRGKIVLVP